MDYFNLNELRKIKAIKNANTAILWQRLEVIFAENNNGFLKFLEPCPSNISYKKGDSWVEDLGFSTAEFRTAFDNIGIRYNSKKDYEDADRSFNGKLYLSYFNKIRGTTHYFRNDLLMDEVRSVLVAGNLDEVDNLLSFGKDQSESLYLIHDTDLNTLKIGRSFTPKARLKHLQTATANKLKLLAVLEDQAKDEKKVHDRFAEYRLSSEWFTYQESIIDYFIPAF